jgi:uncharacterized RDD family membrane protein YckC
MKTIFIVRRVKAFAIDYIIILIYAILLFGASLVISKLFHLDINNIHPVAGELIGFATLTLPVILYFALSESSGYAATIGKRKFRLRVVEQNGTRAGLLRLLIRNFMKFFPWELAHFFIYRLINFTSTGNDVPGFVLTGLIISQVLAVIYFGCILLTKDSRTIYEWLSGTIVIQNT